MRPERTQVGVERGETRRQATGLVRPPTRRQATGLVRPPTRSGNLGRRTHKMVHGVSVLCVVLTISAWSAVSLPQHSSIHVRGSRHQPRSPLRLHRLRGGGGEGEGTSTALHRSGSLEQILAGTRRVASGVARIPSLVFNRTSSLHDLPPDAAGAQRKTAANSASAGGLTPKEEWDRLKKKRKSWPVRQRLWASFCDVCTALAALEQAPGTLMKSKADEKALFLRSVWHGVLPVLSYACCSIYMVISQAYVLRHKRSAGINYSTLLLMYQNMCGLMLYFAEDMLGRQPFPFFDRKSALQMLPNSALFAVMVYSSTRAIKHLAVPMISVFRNFAPITITLVEWLWMKERKPSAGVLFAMALLIIGAMIAAVNDLAFTLEGYLWMLTNVVSNVAHLIVLRKLKLNRDLSNMQVCLGEGCGTS